LRQGASFRRRERRRSGRSRDTGDFTTSRRRERSRAGGTAFGAAKSPKRDGMRILHVAILTYPIKLACADIKPDEVPSVPGV